MRKLFLQLIAEFKRLGCVIVFANFNKIIICTKKSNVADAKANVDFVLASIRNKELFHSLDITYSKSWECLVWLDSANYCGISGELATNNEERVDEMESDENEVN